MTILLAPNVWAQLRVRRGCLRDRSRPTGAVVGDAKVVLKDTKTGITKETTSNSGGTFLFPDLATGMYEIIVTEPSFQTARLTDISVSTSQTTDLRVNMLDARSDVRNGHSDRRRCGDAGDILPIGGEHPYHKDD